HPRGRPGEHGPDRRPPARRGGGVRRGRRRALRRRPGRPPHRAGLGRRRRDDQLRDRHPAEQPCPTRPRLPGGPPVTTWQLPDPAATRELGRRLAGVLRAGDLVVLTGDLGAGKTTLTQGIGAGLGVRGQVASPTFIIARAHPNPGSGPDLVHVDAYRLESLAEVDDLHLDSSLADPVRLVEGLAEDRLEVRIARPRGGLDTAEEVADAGIRTVTVAAHGPRWEGVDLAAVLGTSAEER